MYQILCINDDNEFIMDKFDSFPEAMERLSKLRSDDKVLYMTYLYKQDYKSHCVNYISDLFMSINSYTDLIHTER